MLKQLFGKKTSIETKKIRLDGKTMMLPVATFGNGKGKTLLVTAGMDGDEYASIDAAYQLIERYKEEEIAGKLFIIPIVNISGFEAEMSENPLDRLYPKSTAPQKRGSETHKLMAWVFDEYVKHADVWLDLHGGSVTEELVPFVIAAKTGRDVVDIKTRDLLNAASIQVNVYDEAKHLMSNEAAKRDCVYIISEAGTSAERDTQAISIHTRVVADILVYLGLVQSASSQKKQEAKMYTHTRSHSFAQDGYWTPAVHAGEVVTTGASLGSIASLDRKRIASIDAEDSGLVLWIKQGARAKKGRIFVEIAS